MTGQAVHPKRVGDLLRDWRTRRRLSQMELALEAGVSARHVSFVETGRARPSAEMILHLAEQLDVPLRERNQLLLAGGFAPVYSQRDLDDLLGEVSPVKAALDQILTAHEPAPALAVDRHWGMVAANRAVGLLLTGVAPHLLEPPVNVLRLSLHPEGLAPRIVNLDQWRSHVLDRLLRQAAQSGDPALHALHAELVALPGGADPYAHEQLADLFVPLRLQGPDGVELTFLSTVTTFGTATDITLAELAVEAFFPADTVTADVMRAAAALD
ncbi:transcriptional regulator [Paraconexibacter sp. AEG42_29]|uniref:Transcriptional regulator n=1 Tax=Paraconexibacter sp. AEG42_29 TaxID=2997339 RepID=A0AAU7B0A6_9ACTN